VTTPRRRKTSAASPDQVVELYGPERDGWFDTRVMDWVPLCEQLKDGEVRGYVILRSLIVDKFHKPVRVLTLQKLCELIPSPSGGPSSLTRVRGILDGLTRVGLVTTPEGEPLKTSSRPSATVKPLRIRVNDAAPADYTGWRNAEDKLKALGVALAEQAPAPSDQAGSKAGRKSDPQGGAGRKSDPAGRKSDPRGRESDPDTQGDQRERDLPLVPPSGSSLSGDPDVTPEPPAPAEAVTERESSAAREDDQALDAVDTGELQAPPSGALPQQREAELVEDQERAEVFARSLPGDLGRASVARLVPGIVEAVAEGWTAEALRAYLVRKVDVRRVAEGAVPTLYFRWLTDRPAPPTAARPAAEADMCERHPAFKAGDCPPCIRAAREQADRTEDTGPAPVDGASLLARLRAGQPA